MALPICHSTAPLKFNYKFKSRPCVKFPISVSFPIPKFSISSSSVILCRAANSQTGPVQKKRSSSTGNTKKKKKKNNKTNAGAESDDDSNQLNFTDFEILHDFGADDVEDGPSDLDYRPSTPMPLPEPPAGFVVGDDGKVILTSTDRLATVVSLFFSPSFSIIIISTIIGYGCSQM